MKTMNAAIAVILIFPLAAEAGGLNSRMQSGKCSNWGQVSMAPSSDGKCVGISNCMHEHSTGKARGEPEDSAHLHGIVRKMANAVSSHYYPQTNQPIVLVSGYRSAANNRGGTGNGRARCSQHMLGNATDLRVEGVSAEQVRSVCIQNGARFTLVYRGHNYVHCDMRGQVSAHLADVPSLDSGLRTRLSWLTRTRLGGSGYQGNVTDPQMYR